MRHIGFVLVVAVVLIASSAIAGRASESQEREQPLPRFEETYAWFRLAAQHQAGRVDQPLRTLADWPVGRIHRVRHDLRLVQLLMTNAANGGGSASLPATRNGPISVAGLTLRMEDLEPLLGLPAGAIGPRPDPRMVAAPGGTARRAIAVVMARAAAMHTDLMLAASADLALAGASSRNSETSATRIVDGERSDIWSSAVYWEVARQAMDHVLVTPRGGAPTRDWYYATLEFLLSRREYDAALPHAAYGRLVLKTDGRIAFYLGAILENLASPNVQAAVGDNPARVGLEERPVLLHRAEEALRSALELDPKLDEAALRLARVCQVTGRYEDAANLLRRIESTLNRAELRYYAALFVGRSEEALGREPEARAAFERARELFPAAQSPYLALAGVSWRAADSAAATGAIRALPDARRMTSTFDPWWMYDVSPADSLLDRLAAARVAFDAFLK